ncbi:MAG: hypothetical protein Q8Q08_03515 [Candidatus Omnitrophota bacterium]|nr:hypothetical protein [Candidatus Omnitrophota bacterium]MDZ4243210.1 hypothetical protein [Candidatus Omnitrophota bacterium]
MKSLLIVLSLVATMGVMGCETVKEGTTAAGTAVGKGADAVGGVTEGAAEGYKGKDVTANNPYGR